MSKLNQGNFQQGTIGAAALNNNAHLNDRELRAENGYAEGEMLLLPNEQWRVEVRHIGDNEFLAFVNLTRGVLTSVSALTRSRNRVPMGADAQDWQQAVQANPFTSPWRTEEAFFRANEGDLYRVRCHHVFNLNNRVPNGRPVRVCTFELIDQPAQQPAPQPMQQPAPQQGQYYPQA